MLNLSPSSSVLVGRKDSMPVDRDLIEKIREGDQDACEILCARHEEGLRRYLLRLVHDPAAAEDLLQETFLRLWTRAAQWRGKGAVKSWLFSIARNLAFNHLDSVRRRRQQPLEPPVEPAEEDDEGNPSPAWMADRRTPGADVLLEQAEEHQLLRDAIDTLPQSKRQVFYMVYDGDMEIHEVARELDLPAGTVKSRLFYARKHIAEAWRRLQNEWEDI